jgi:hypothetical protein
MDSIKVSVNRNEPKKLPAKRPAVQNEPKTASSRPKNSGWLKSFAIILATAVIAGGAIYTWISRLSADEINQAKADMSGIKSDLENKITDLQNKIKQVETENFDLKGDNEQLKSLASMLDHAQREFDSPELGIKFVYPAGFGEIKWTIEKGKTGKIFNALFSNNDKLSLGAITPDYSAGRDLVFTDTQGYFKDGAKYYYLSAGADGKTDYPLEPLKIIDVNGDDILLLDKNSFASGQDPAKPALGPGDNGLGALINLKGKEFTGLAIWNKDLQSLPQEKIEAILNTIQIK